MQYEDIIIEFLNSTNINKGKVLDFGSGPKLRHPNIFLNYFSEVHAVEKEAKKETVEANRTDNGKINVIYGEMQNIEFTNKYDLISFCWPETLYYSFFVENTILKRNCLKKNGKALFVLLDSEGNSNEEKIAILQSKIMIHNHRQKPIFGENVVYEIEKQGAKIIENEIHYLGTNVNTEYIDVSSEIDTYSSNYLTDEDKEMYKKYKKEKTKVIFGNFRIILAEFA